MWNHKIVSLPGGYIELRIVNAPILGAFFLAVCCASAQNCIKIHESEFLYLVNCQSSPDNRDFCIFLQKSTSATGCQEAAGFTPKSRRIRGVLRE
jgi:hypothetical protein